MSKLGDRWDPIKLLALGTGLTSLGMLLLINVPIDAPYATSFLPRLLVIGLGMAMFVAPITKLAVAVTSEHSGVASGQDWPNRSRSNSYVSLLMRLWDQLADPIGQMK